jgi:hypothetical protein
MALSTNGWARVRRDHIDVPLPPNAEEDSANATVVFYGLFQENSEAFRVVHPWFEVRGRQPARADVIRFTDQASTWWAKFAGADANNIRQRGRPKGQGKLPDDPQWLYDAYQDYTDLMDEERTEGKTKKEGFTQKEFVEYVAPVFGTLTMPTFRAYLKKHDIPWPPQ